MQEPLRCRLVVVIVSVPCEQGPLGRRLLIIAYEYHVSRSYLVVDYLLLFQYYVSRCHLVVDQYYYHGSREHKVANVKEVVLFFRHHMRQGTRCNLIYLLHDP